jgi:two-component system CheB/CheR fusion protein
LHDDLRTAQGGFNAEYKSNPFPERARRFRPPLAGRTEAACRTRRQGSGRYPPFAAMSVLPPTKPVPTRIVGIGASAGGLDAFHSFFQAMPPDSGMAFVVILHLPVGRKSMLPEILGRWTAMQVLEGEDGASIEPNCVYVPPPHAIATVEEGRLRIRMPASDAPREYRPIDGFFDSLAADLREDAVGIVLSGTGSDGSLGLKAIKQCGGLTIAQGTDGGGPQYDGMPAGAIATGAVDLIAPAEAIPGHLLRLNTLPAAETEPGEASAEETNAARLVICAILRTQLGHDFSGYKDKTFMRRVQRRMQVLGIRSLPDYAARLENDHEEVVSLFRDLLIRVTGFFRDSEAFAALERLVMPRLFADKHADDAVRVWVPGCATGEEAYSLAILLREQMDRLRGPPKVQVFGTDIDEPAIAAARLGRFPPTLLEGLSPGRRERFFHASHSGYVVAKEIRELCTFSPHSLVRDPPFSRMDLISCRNLLIYMDNDLQSVILPMFHYSLVPSGILLLGSSESTSRHEDLFQPLDKAARIFEKRNVRGPPISLSRPAPGQAVRRPASAAWTEQRPIYAEALALLERERAARRAETAASTAAGGPAVPGSGLFGRLSLELGRGLQAAMRRLLPAIAAVQEVRDELVGTREQLQSVTEQYETALEEIRSANEELHSVNEELQSTNEELETSKEELQSVNEELNTVNVRLSEKVDELDRANSDLQNLFDSTQIATIFLDRHLIVRGFTPAVAGIYNLIPSDKGRPLTDIVSQLRYNGLRDDVQQVLDTLEPLERRVTREDQQTHYIMRILPYRAPDSTVSGTLVTFLDVTSIVQAEQHHRLLVDELNHRVKNMLTVVVSLAAQTLRRSATLEEFSEAFMGRVQALTASYTLLSGQNWLSVSLRDLLAEETRPYAAPGRNNIVMEGPCVRLAAAGVLAIGMAIHELATNAIKYGALSVPEGIVTITWRFDYLGGEKQLVLEWVETNGPAVRPPGRRGFGTTLLERGLAHELCGEAHVEFDEKGVRAMLRAPVGAAVALGPAIDAATTP